MEKFDLRQLVQCLDLPRHVRRRSSDSLDYRHKNVTTVRMIQHLRCCAHVLKTCACRDQHHLNSLVEFVYQTPTNQPGHCSTMQQVESEASEADRVKSAAAVARSPSAQTQALQLRVRELPE